MTHKIYSILLLLCLSCYGAPRITLIIVLDQLSDEMFIQQAPYYQGMLKMLKEKGITFSQCYHPHAKPKTAPGHATFATGARACEHGIVDNGWYNNAGNRIQCDTSSTENTAVFHPYAEESYTFGKSPHNMWVDTIFDQCSLHSNTITRIVIAGKSRASIMFAGRHGHAIWFDHRSGGFTSSKAYYHTLPNWLKRFNRDNALAQDTQLSWQPAYQAGSKTYHSNIAAYPGNPNQPEFNKSYRISQTDEALFTSYLATPQGQKRLISCARAGLEYYISEHPDNNIVMCLSLSSLDYVGHYHGPESKEYRDIIHHADQDLMELYSWLTSQIPPEEVLVIFTSDHGAMPIPEQMHKNGMEFAQRISEQAFIQEINESIQNRFGISDYIHAHSQPWLYVNQEKHQTLSAQQKSAIAEHIIQYLQSKPYIITAFTFQELQQMPTPYEQSPQRLLQNQVTPGRTGEFVYLIRPYCNVTSYTTGTTHATPYAYDTHVPLIIYQPGMYEHAHVTQYVSTQQLAPTLADILNIPRPSCAYMPLLPLPRPLLQRDIVTDT